MSVRLSISWAVGCLVGLLAAAPAAAQIREAEFRVHDRGELWETAKDDGTLGAPAPLDPFEYFPSLDWPGGPEVLTSKEEQRSYHAGAGLWIGGHDAGGTVFFDEMGPFQTVEVAEVTPIEEVENFVGESGFDPTQAEETIVAEFTTTTGLRVRRTSRAWSFRGLNTFVLLDYAVTNETSGALLDVFVGVPALLRPSYQDVNVHNGWGDDFNRTDELVAYDAERALVYTYDDTPSFDLPGDVGNYWAERDELRTTGYAGIALLDAPPGSGGEAQPATVFWAQTLSNENRLTTASTSAAALYAILAGKDVSLQADEGDRLTPLTLLGCGPYNLAPGETVRLAFVEAVNGLPLDVALEGLEAQDELSAGLDSLQASIDRAPLALRGELPRLGGAAARAAHRDRHPSRCRVDGLRHLAAYRGHVGRPTVGLAHRRVQRLPQRAWVYRPLRGTHAPSDPCGQRE